MMPPLSPDRQLSWTAVSTESANLAVVDPESYELEAVKWKGAPGQYGDGRHYRFSGQIRLRRRICQRSRRTGRPANTFRAGVAGRWRACRLPSVERLRDADCGSWGFRGKVNAIPG